MRPHKYDSTIPGVEYNRVYTDRWEMFFRGEFIGWIRKSSFERRYWARQVDGRDWAGPFPSKDAAASVVCFPGGPRG